MADFRLFIAGENSEPALNPSGAQLMGLGTSSYPATISEADRKFISLYLRNNATSGDGRGLYLRFYVGGAGGGGEAARLYTTVKDVAAATAHGAHISLDFGSTGTVTGQGIASRNTLHLPDVALSSNVTLAATQSEIYCDGSASDPGASTLLSFQRFVLGGHADGITDVNTKSYFWDIQGLAAGGDGVNSIFRTAAPTTLAASLKVLIGSTKYYLPLYSAQS
jgi:hypothetical protein